MIWNPDAECGSGDPVVSDIVKQAADMCGSDVLGQGRHVLELARAVSCFLRRECQGVFLDSKHLAALASRALVSIGEEDVARHFLLLGTGLVEISAWESVGYGEVWVIDLGRIVTHGEAPNELAFFACLKIVLEAVADAWDESVATTIGLRHLDGAVSALLGRSMTKRKRSALAGEVTDLCKRKIESMSREKGWVRVPGVMSLDI